MKKPLPTILQHLMATAALLCLTAFFHPVLAQPGTLDASFNAADQGNGLGDEANGQIIAIKTQSDGKILLGGGFTTYGGQSRNYIARVNTDGTLDNTFNPGTGADGIVYDIAVQSDNKIIVVGTFSTFNGVSRNKIVRLNADGSIDNTFDPGTAANDTLWAVGVQSDGKIIIGGELTAYNGTTTTRVTRLNANGTLDATFNPGTGPSFDVLTLAVGTDNKIVVGGLFTQFNGVSRSGFARLNADGSLDNTFNIGTGSNAAITTCAIQADGKVLIGGDFTTINGSAINRLVRLNTDGSRDATFNIGTGFNFLVWSLAIQADGKVLVAGNFNTFNGSPQLFLARLNTNGSLDNSLTIGSGPNVNLFAIAVKDNGKVLIGGGFTLYNGFSSIAFAQLNSNGTFDTGFNVGTGANRDILTSLIQSDGKIYLGGRMGKYFGNHQFGIIRINPNGSFDNTFNTGGAGTNNSVAAMVQQGDGKLIIGGLFTSYNGTAVNRLARLNANGSLDASYNTTAGANTGSVNAMLLLPDGKLMIGGSFTQYGGVARGQIARVNIDGSNDATFNPGSGGGGGNVLAIARQTDGKLIVGGAFTTYNGTARARIARINADGSLDNTFSVGTGFADNSVSTIAIQTDGKIIVGGSFTSFNGTPVGRVVRLNADGSLDATFNTGSGAGDNTVFSSMVLNDGRILLGGTFTTFNGTPQGNLVLLSSNGSIDPIFETGTGAGGAFSSVRTISMQTDGKFIIAGNFVNYNNTGRNRVARINGLPSNPITTETPPAGPYCPGSSISIPFSVSTTINPGNTFTAQLSNASGSFASPVNIGTLNGTTSGSISATIPVPTASGVGYKIRVVSSNPALTGTEVGINIQAVQVFFKDADNDGYSDSTTQVACVPPPGYKLQGALAGPQKDCNDNNNTVYPGAPEIENDGIDQDCNGEDKVTTGIRDLKAIQASVFPNPNTGNFNISILAPESGEYLINIMDVSGRLIQSETINIGPGLQVLPLSINQKGMYIISLQGQSQQATVKVAVH